MKELKNMDTSEIIAKIIVSVFLAPLIAMWVWNRTVVGVFGVAELGYWQMFWIAFALRFVLA